MLRFRLEFDTRNKPHCAEHCNHRGASVAEERKSDADNGSYADAHPYVDKCLKRNRRRNADTDKHIKSTSCFHGGSYTVNYDYRQKDNDDKAAYHAEFLSRC